MDQDQVTKKLFENIPQKTADTFTEEQISAIKIAFGARKWSKHPLDIRGVIKIWRWRFYYVILAGKERRNLSRNQEETAFLIKGIFLFLFISFSILTGLLTIYLVKSALGIDLIPGYSTGIWDFFKSSF